MKLAVDGGTPVRSTPLPPWPVFSEDEQQAVVDVLRSGKVNYWTGDACKQFEAEYAQALGVSHTISVANGTLSLELLLRAFGVSPGDEVITTPRTFMASASAVRMCGATPTFADVDADSGNITAESIARAITPRTKAIIPVHLGGWPCEMTAIMDLADAHGLKVIEDCAQAHHATYRGRQIGSIGHAGSFSFCQDKILTTGGEGGLISTSDEALWRDCWALNQHGKSYEAVHEREHAPGYRWVVESTGTNARMTEMQAAIGRLILAKLPGWSAKRATNAEALHEAFAGFESVRVPRVPAHMTHANYKFYAYVQPEALAEGWDRDRVMAAINAEGIPCYSGSCSEIYLEKALADVRPAEPLPVAKALGETSLMMLVHPTLRTKDMADMADAVRKVLTHATR